MKKTIVLLCFLTFLSITPPVAYAAANNPEDTRVESYQDNVAEKTGWAQQKWWAKVLDICTLIMAPVFGFSLGLFSWKQINELLRLKETTLVKIIKIIVLMIFTVGTIVIVCNILFLG